MFRQTNFFDMMGIEIEENSEDEILNSIKEMLKFVDNEIILTGNDELLQNFFRTIFFKMILICD